MDTPEIENKNSTRLGGNCDSHIFNITIRLRFNIETKHHQFGRVTTSVNIGVYKNSLCTQNLTSISWGFVSPRDNITATAYIRNLGNQDVTLNLGTANWNPAQASQYLTLTWNYQNQVIKPNEIRSIIFTLSASKDMIDIGQFSFDIVITSSG